MGDCLGLQQCGTNSGYSGNAQCRGPSCSTARAEYAARSRRLRKPKLVSIGPRRADIAIPPLCTHCHDPIEKCDGMHGDWMHTESRRELCGSGRLASPETPDQVRKVPA